MADRDIAVTHRFINRLRVRGDVFDQVADALDYAPMTQAITTWLDQF